MSSAVLWEPYVDELGQTYYYNAETGETSWHIPSATVVSALSSDDSDSSDDTDAVSEVIRASRDERVATERWKSGTSSVIDVCRTREELRRVTGRSCTHCGARVKYEASVIRCSNPHCQRQACRRCASFVMKGDYSGTKRWICPTCDVDRDVNNSMIVEVNSHTSSKITIRTASSAAAMSSSIANASARAARRAENAANVLVREILISKDVSPKHWMAHFAAATSVAEMASDRWLHAVRFDEKRETCGHRLPLQTTPAELTKIVRDMDETFLKALSGYTNPNTTLLSTQTRNETLEMAWTKRCESLDLQQWIESHDETVFHHLSQTRGYDSHSLWNRCRENELRAVSRSKVVTLMANVLHEDDGKGRGRVMLQTFGGRLWRHWWSDTKSRSTPKALSASLRRYLHGLFHDVLEASDRNSGEEVDNGMSQDMMYELLRKLGMHKIAKEDVDIAFQVILTTSSNGSNRVSFTEFFHWIKRSDQRYESSCDLQRTMYRTKLLRRLYKLVCFHESMSMILGNAICEAEKIVTDFYRRKFPPIRAKRIYEGNKLRRQRPESPSSRREHEKSTIRSDVVVTNTPFERITIHGKKRLILRNTIGSYREFEILPDPTTAVRKTNDGKDMQVGPQAYRWLYVNMHKPVEHPGWATEERMPVHVSRHWLMLEKQPDQRVPRYSVMPRRWLYEQHKLETTRLEATERKYWSDRMQRRREEESQRRYRVAHQNTEDRKRLESLKRIERGRWNMLIRDSVESSRNEHDCKLPCGWISRKIRRPRCYYVNERTGEALWRHSKRVSRERGWHRVECDIDDVDVRSASSTDVADTTTSKDVNAKDTFNDSTIRDDNDDLNTLKIVAKRARMNYRIAAKQARKTPWNVPRGQLRRLRVAYKSAKRAYFVERQRLGVPARSSLVQATVDQGPLGVTFRVGANGLDMIVHDIDRNASNGEIMYAEGVRAGMRLVQFETHEVIRFSAASVLTLLRYMRNRKKRLAFDEPVSSNDNSSPSQQKQLLRHQATRTFGRRHLDSKTGKRIALEKRSVSVRDDLVCIDDEEDNGVSTDEPLALVWEMSFGEALDDANTSSEGETGPVQRPHEEEDDDTKLSNDAHIDAKSHVSTSTTLCRTDEITTTDLTIGRTIEDTKAIATTSQTDIVQIRSASSSGHDDVTISRTPERLENCIRMKNADVPFDILIVEIARCFHHNLSSDDDMREVVWPGARDVLCGNLRSVLNERNSSKRAGRGCRHRISCSDFLNLAKRSVSWRSDRKSELKTLATRETRRTFNEYVKIPTSRVFIRDTHEKMKKLRESNPAAFWRIYKDCRVPMMNKEKLTHETKATIASIFMHKCFDESISSQFQSNAELSFHQMSTLLDLLVKLDGERHELDLRDADDIWIQLGGENIRDVDMTALLADQTNTNSTFAMSKSRLFAHTAGMTTNASKFRSSRANHVHRDVQKEHNDFVEETDVIDVDDVSDDVKSATRESAVVAFLAVRDMNLKVHPILALVATVGALRAAEKSVTLSLRYISVAVVVRAAMVSRNAAKHAQHVARCAKQHVFVPRITLTSFAELLIFGSTSTNKITRRVFSSSDRQLHDCLHRCDRCVGRARLLPSRSKAIHDQVVSGARRFASNVDAWEELKHRLKTFYVRVQESNVERRHLDIDEIRRVPVPPFKVNDPDRSEQVCCWVPTTIFYQHLASGKCQWEHPQVEKGTRIADSEKLRSIIEEREVLERCHETEMDLKFVDWRRQEMNRRAMFREDVRSSAFEEYLRRIPEEREMTIQGDHARRFKAITRRFTARKRPFMSRYRWLYTDRVDRDNYVHRVRCVSSGKTFWMRESIMCRRAAKATIRALRALQNRACAYLPTIEGIAGCPEGNGRHRVVLVLQRSIEPALETLVETAWNDADVMKFARAIVTAILALHGSGLYHGQLSPASVVCASDPEKRFRIFDFKLNSTAVHAEMMSKPRLDVDISGVESVADVKNDEDDNDEDGYEGGTFDGGDSKAFRERCVIDLRSVGKLLHLVCVGRKSWKHNTCAQSTAQDLLRTVPSHIDRRLKQIIRITLGGMDMTHRPATSIERKMDDTSSQRAERDALIAKELRQRYEANLPPDLRADFSAVHRGYGIRRRRRSVEVTATRLAKILGLSSKRLERRTVRNTTSMRRQHIHVKVGKGVKHYASESNIANRSHSKKGTSKMAFALRRRTAMLKTEDLIGIASNGPRRRSSTLRLLRDD